MNLFHQSFNWFSAIFHSFLFCALLTSTHLILQTSSIKIFVFLYTFFILNLGFKLNLDVLIHDLPIQFVSSKISDRNFLLYQFFLNILEFDFYRPAQFSKSTTQSQYSFPFCFFDCPGLTTINIFIQHKYFLLHLHSRVHFLFYSATLLLMSALFVYPLRLQDL